MCDSSTPASGAVEAELAAAPQGRAARLVLDLGCADAEAAAVARDLARGVLTQVEAMLADPATDLPAHLRDALAALAGALAEQTAAHRARLANEEPEATAQKRTEGTPVTGC